MKGQVEFEKKIVPVIYEHETLKVVLMINDDEEIMDVISKAKQSVMQGLGLVKIEQVKPQEKVEEVKEEVKTQVKEEKKTKKSKAKKEEVEEEEMEIVRKDGVDVDRKEIEEVPVIEEEKPKKGKSKITKYERKKELQSVLGNFLTELVGGKQWMTKKGITEFSSSLVGDEFLDENGNILESFKQKCAEFFEVGESAL